MEIEQFCKARNIAFSDTGDQYKVGRCPYACYPHCWGFFYHYYNKTFQVCADPQWKCFSFEDMPAAPIFLFAEIYK